MFWICHVPSFSVVVHEAIEAQPCPSADNDEEASQRSHLTPCTTLRPNVTESTPIWIVFDFFKSDEARSTARIRIQDGNLATAQSPRLLFSLNANQSVIIVFFLLPRLDTNDLETQPVYLHHSELVVKFNLGMWTFPLRIPCKTPVLQ